MGDKWCFSRTKKSGEIERKKWRIRGREEGEQDERKQQNIIGVRKKTCILDFGEKKPSLKKRLLWFLAFLAVTTTRFWPLPGPYALSEKCPCFSEVLRM